MQNVTNRTLLNYWLCLFLGIVLTGCSDSRALEPSAEPKAESTRKESGSVATESNDTVRILTRLPAFSLLDQDGKELASHDLYGHVWVANFVFTRCRASCPVQTALMQRLQVELKDSASWKHTRLVSISVEPEYDRPEVLASYIDDRKLETSQWHFLTGAKDDVWSLIRKGFKLPVADAAENANMPIMHSNMIVLVDWEGRIRGY